jgi:pyrroloquinoline quinone (PQQ) biosynthesis protein C
MMETNTQSKQVITPTDAVEQFVGEQFIDWLLDYITYEVKIWPGTTGLADSQYKRERLQKFMRQRYLDAKAVWGGQENDPGFLEFIIANLSEVSDPAAERALTMIEDQEAQEKNGLSREPWLKLLGKLGISVEDAENTEPKEATRNYISILSDVYSSQEWQTAVGALVAYQKVIALESEVILGILKSSFDLTDSDMEILRALASENKKYILNPSRLLSQLVVDQENKELVMQGVYKQLEARKSYYEKLMKYLE